MSAQRLQEFGAASVKYFAATAAGCFKRDLSESNFYLMPLPSVRLLARAETVVLNPEEKNFLPFVEGLEAKHDDPAARYSVSVNIEISSTRSKAKDALEVRLTEEQVREEYPWDLDRLTAECRKRYSAFKLVQKYHDLRKRLAGEAKSGYVRQLEQGNPRSPEKPFFNPNILAEFDKHYTLVK